MTIIDDYTPPDNDKIQPPKPPPKRRPRKKGMYKDATIIDTPDKGLVEQKRLQAERDRKKYQKANPPPKMPKINKLTGTTLNLKETRFVDEFIKDLAPGAAAQRAGYSPNSASTMGGILLKRKDVKTLVQKKEHALTERNHLSQDRVLQELCSIAFLDIRELFTKRGKLKPIHLMPERVTRALAGIDVTQKYIKTEKDADGNHVKLEYERITKVRVRDKMKALELLGRHMGMFGEGETDRLPDLASLLLEARHRINEIDRQRGAVDADYTIAGESNDDQAISDGDGTT